MSKMFSHERVIYGKDEWLTPPYVVTACGPFDLDPCSPINRPWDTAAAHLTIDDDGFTADWNPAAFVWCNPPYGKETYKWLRKLASHPAGGIALVFARTETVGFFDAAWADADALLFLKGRLSFHHVDGSKGGTAGAPSVLIAYGKQAVERLQNCGLSGALVTKWDLLGTSSGLADEGTVRNNVGQPEVEG